MKTLKRAFFWLNVALARELGFIDAGDGKEYTREEQAKWAQNLIKSPEWKDVLYLDEAAGFTQKEMMDAIRSVNALIASLPEGLQRRADEWPAYAVVQEIKRIQKYLADHDGSAEGLESDFVFHLDGKSNGLQHMAACLKNRVTAVASNILPIPDGERPNDPYGILAKAALQCEPLDNKGNSTPAGRQAIEAIRNMGRDMAKTPLMILAYGATESTIDNRISEVLEKNHVEGSPRLIREAYMEGVQEEFPACLDLTMIVKEAMDKRLTEQFGPRDEQGRRHRGLRLNAYTGYRPDGVKRQKWIKVTATGTDAGDVKYTANIPTDKGVFKANLIMLSDCWIDQNGGIWQKDLTDEDVALTWFSQDGFFCRMLEKNEEESLVRAGQIAIKTNTPIYYDYGKMMGAASPNFIHSCDANHFRVTTNLFEGELLGIHDSYGCHITDVDRLLECISEAWVITHSRDNLNHFLERIWLGDDVKNAHHCVIEEFDIAECGAARNMFS